MENNLNSISILASTPSPEANDENDILLDEEKAPPKPSTAKFDDDSDDADELIFSQFEELNQEMNEEALLLSAENAS